MRSHNGFSSTAIGNSRSRSRSPFTVPPLMPMCSRYGASSLHNACCRRGSLFRDTAHFRRQPARRVRAGSQLPESVFMSSLHDERPEWMGDATIIATVANDCIGSCYASCVERAAEAIAALGCRTLVGGSLGRSTSSLTRRQFGSSPFLASARSSLLTAENPDGTFYGMRSMGGSLRSVSNQTSSRAEVSSPVDNRSHSGLIAARVAQWDDTDRYLSKFCTAESFQLSF